MLSILDPLSRRGRELCDFLVRAFPDHALACFHTSGLDEHLLTEVAGAARLVKSLENPDELIGSTAVILNALPPPEIRARLATWFALHPTVPVVDYSPRPVLVATEAAVFGGPSSPAPGERRLQSLDVALTGPAHVLAAISSLGVRFAQLTLLTPVGDLGETAIEELFAQALARLAGEQPARPQVLSEILAFDLAPVPAARQEHLTAQLGQLGFPTTPQVIAVATSSFYGHFATVSVLLDGARRRSEIEAALRRYAAAHLRLASRLRNLSRLVDGNEVHCTQIQGERDSWSLLLAYDGHRLVGPAAVIDLLAPFTAA